MRRQKTLHYCLDRAKECYRLGESDKAWTDRDWETPALVA